MHKGFPTLIVPDVRLISGEIDLTVECDGRFDPPIEEIGRLVAVFTQAGELGAFPAAAHSGGPSRIGRIAGPKSSDQSIAFEMTASGITPQAFQILRNLLGWSEAIHGGVASLRIRDKQRRDQGRTAPFPGDVDEEDAYPPPWEKLGFAIDWENTQYSKSRRCLIEAARPLETADVEQVAETARAWSALLDEGGFVLPSDFPSETESSSGSVSQFDEYSVEISVLRFQASEMAWASLANMIDASCRTSLQVIRMIVE